MLFTEQELNATNALNVLEEATYLSEEESLINPTTIPVKEVSRLGYGVVRFDDVEKLAEDYGVDYIDAMYAIAESSNMNPEYLAVSVPEEDIIAYPEIVNELANIVVQPLSESDFGYRYVDMCLEAWDNTGDDSYLEAIVDDSCLEEAAMLLEGVPENDDYLNDIGTGASLDDLAASSAADAAGTPNLKLRANRLKKKVGDAYSQAGSDIKAAWGQEGIKNKVTALGKAAWKNKAVVGGTTAAAAAGAYGVYRFAKYVKEARNKPKSWIGKKVAALRSIYQKWMQQAQKNPQKAGIIKSAAAKLLSIIDALMAQLQRAAG